MVHPVPPSPRQTGLVERSRRALYPARRVERCASISEADVYALRPRTRQASEHAVDHPKDRRVAELSCSRARRAARNRRSSVRMLNVATFRRIRSPDALLRKRLVEIPNRPATKVPITLAPLRSSKISDLPEAQSETSTIIRCPPVAPRWFRSPRLRSMPSCPGISTPTATRRPTLQRRR